MRNYKKEYENYHSRPEQKLRRAARNAARAVFKRAIEPEKLEGKDVHHKDNNPLNNDKKNLSLVTQDSKMRIISFAILSISIVALIQGIFGITLFSAKYSQVFWLLVGYVYLLNHDNKIRYINA